MIGRFRRNWLGLYTRKEVFTLVTKAGHTFQTGAQSLRGKKRTSKREYGAAQGLDFALAILEALRVSIVDRKTDVLSGDPLTIPGDLGKALEEEEAP